MYKRQEVFNRVEEDGTPEYEFNDNCMENAEEAYHVLVEKSEEKLQAEALSLPQPSTEPKVDTENATKQKQEKKLCDSLCKPMESSSESITISINSEVL